MRIFHYPSKASEAKLNRIINRGIGFRQKDLKAVQRIIDDVRKNGDAAVIKYVNQYDAPDLPLEGLEVSAAEFEAAKERVDPDFTAALDRAIVQIRQFHRNQVQKSWITRERNGTLLGQLVSPVDGAGVYVPGGQGGQTPLVSSVLMGAIPAGIAGVPRIDMVTPPTRDGRVNPHLLVAAQKAGVNTVYKAGSAWAIAALAYGTDTIAKADVIVGPGNIYVTLAKKLISGTTGIDMVAGPSEILIIADNSANPAYLAADLLSQAEHDPLASAVLITTSRTVAKRVKQALSEQLEPLDRRDIAAASIRDYGAILVVSDLDEAFALSNRIAPEHLELQIREPFTWIEKVRNAGAVFMGPYTPEPVGDYIAGPNHVLPTAGTARFSSALSVDHFQKKTSLLHYSRKAFAQEAQDIICLADIEGLGAHSNAVRLRLKKE
jgi:histidinol dehydrogenase